MKTLFCIAAAAIASLGIAAPASAKPAGVELAMASFAAVSTAPDAATREAYLRARFEKHRGHGKCEGENCAAAINCIDCDECDCVDGACTPSCHDKTENVGKVASTIAPASA